MTALNPLIGYEKATSIAKVRINEASYFRRCVRQTDLSEKELKRLLDPTILTGGGIMNNDMINQHEMIISQLFFLAQASPAQAADVVDYYRRNGDQRGSHYGIDNFI